MKQDRLRRETQEKYEHSPFTPKGVKITRLQPSINNTTILKVIPLCAFIGTEFPFFSNSNKPCCWCWSHCSFEVSYSNNYFASSRLCLILFTINLWTQTTNFFSNAVAKMNLNKLVKKRCIKSKNTGAHKILGAHCLRQEWNKVLGGVVLCALAGTCFASKVNVS